jgi:cell wall-associated NlpC family hydrolase
MASRKGAAIAAAFGVALALGQAHHHHHHHGPGNLLSAFTSQAAPGPAAQTAISYARAQLGKPYLWGGTGPDAFDCSGLVMEAYASAGISLERTSQMQWASEKHIPRSERDPGDLVFFAGIDGTMASPGHVGILVTRNLMIDAPQTGENVQVESYLGRPDLVGFTDPTAGG